MGHGPHDLADGIGGIVAVSGNLIEPPVPDPLRQQGLLRYGTLIRPDDGRPQQRAAAVQQHRAHHMAAEADAGNPGRVHQRRQGLGGPANRCIPCFRILLHTIAAAVGARITGYHAFDQRAIHCEQGGLIAGSSEIMG